MANIFRVPDDDAFTAIGLGQDFLLYDTQDQDWLTEPALMPTNEQWSADIPHAQTAGNAVVPSTVSDEQLLQSLVAASETTAPDHELSTAGHPVFEPTMWEPDSPDSNLAGTSPLAEQETVADGQHEAADLHACRFAKCARIFDNPKSLRNHEKRCQNGRIPKHVCTTCQKRYWYPKDRRRCEDKHAHARVKCPACPKVYSRRDNMVRHLANKHSGHPIPSVAESSPSVPALSVQPSPQLARHSQSFSSQHLYVGENIFHQHNAVESVPRPTSAPWPGQVSMVRSGSNATSFMDVDSIFSPVQAETPLTVPDSVSSFIDPQLLHGSQWSGPLFDDVIDRCPF